MWRQLKFVLSRNVAIFLLFYIFILQSDAQNVVNTDANGKVSKLDQKMSYMNNYLGCKRQGYI